MMFRSLAILIFIIFSFPLVSFGSDESPMTGYELAVSMDNVDNSYDSISVGTMTIKRGDKTLVRAFDLYTKQVNQSKEEERVLFVFNEPADVKGTTYLEWTYIGLDKQDDLWVFLPSESLIRRISGSSMYASFMRSDLANEDLQNMDDVDEYSYELLDSQVVDGIDCYVLVRRPKEKKDTQYSKHVQWVRKDNLLRYKVEYYDKKDKLLKTMYFDACELIDGIWTNTKLRVEKADGKSSTLVDWSKIKYNVGLKDEYFEHSNLHR